MPFPFPVLDCPPGNWKDIFDNQAILAIALNVCSNMAIAHNMFIRGINAVYAQAEGIKKDQVKPFVFFCVSFLGMIHHHHHLEETLLFPFFETKLGAKAMEHNVEQHHEFMDRLNDLEKYLKEVQAGKVSYNGTTIIEKLDTFSDSLVQHLADEIPTLESSKMRAAFTVKELEVFEAEFGKRILKEVSLSIDLPLGFICHDKSTAPHFPPLPTPVMWLAKYGLFRLHSDAWAFGPCDVHGVVKPGLGNDSQLPSAQANA
ncbi:hypothetical protein GGX14DRAFT_629689 [Mycena pura]|uniref:Hemerythrin-like domain-containing protein n=1 Tax=Mycena pura TaxID=153505 RepID=A0AAD6YRV8_9AGAR|nr:hypothetical protein GGX14DRAFT_629689 [Mycena pura]